jgi:threonine/homoserine/homoserine lactone efflux protein
MLIARPSVAKPERVGVNFGGRISVIAEGSRRTVGGVPPADRLVAFALTAFAIIIVPGPSVLFVISRGVALGRRAALATVLGNAGGLMVQLVLVAAGLGAVLERSVVLFTAVKLVGAAYLCWLGVQTLRHRRSLAVVDDAAATPRSARRILREGFVVGVTNPKMAVFLAAILPQFAEPDRGHMPLQLLVLGLCVVAIALVCDSCWGLLAGTARAWLTGSPRRLELLGGAGGLVIVGLGVRLALTRSDA